MWECILYRSYHYCLQHMCLGRPCSRSNNPYVVYNETPAAPLIWTQEGFIIISVLGSIYIMYMLGPYCLNFVPQYSRQSLDCACSLHPTTKSILEMFTNPTPQVNQIVGPLSLSHCDGRAVTIVGVTWVCAFTTFKRKHDDSVWKLHPTSLVKESSSGAS